jgi:hypothetical protein
MKPKKGPSQQEIMSLQEKAAEKERSRVEQEQAAKKAETEQKALADMEATEGRRRAFAGALALFQIARNGGLG